MHSVLPVSSSPVVLFASTFPFQLTLPLCVINIINEEERGRMCDANDAFALFPLSL